MIKKVVFRQSETVDPAEPFRVWVVSYDDTPDRKYYKATNAIIKFTANKKPVERMYSNGKTRCLIWE